MKNIIWKNWSSLVGGEQHFKNENIYHLHSNKIYRKCFDLNEQNIHFCEGNAVMELAFLLKQK